MTNRMTATSSGSSGITVADSNLNFGTGDFTLGMWGRIKTVNGRYTPTLIRGLARDNDSVDESRAERQCALGVGCGTSGVCYAEVNGRPDMCGRIKTVVDGEHD